MSLLWLLLLVAAKLLLSLYAIVVAIVVYVVFIVFTFVADAHNVGVIVGTDASIIAFVLRGCLCCCSCRCRCCNSLLTFTYKLVFMAQLTIGQTAKFTPKDA